MDVRLKHVVAVAKHGSFTAAAKSIGITQSTVTRGVADLEHQLGNDIFYRTARGALLTEFGRAFAERAARHLDDEVELMRGVVGKADPFAGILRIGVSPASLEWSLTAPIVALKRKHPAIKFQVIGTPLERMVPMIRNGGVDLVLGFDEAFSEWPDLKRVHAWDLFSTLFARAAHPLATCEHVTSDVIADYELVSPSESQPYGTILRAIYESRGIDWRTRIHEIDHFPIVRGIIENSDALGIVAVSHAQSPIFRKKFCVVHAERLFRPVPICCVMRKRWQPGPAARALIAAIRMMGDSVVRSHPL